PLALPAGTGGAVGGALLQLAYHVGLAPLALPLAMTAAALVAALLLSIMGLSWGDWRAIGGGAGRGASRLARASGRGTAAAAVLGGRAVGYWRAVRRDFDEGPPEPPIPPRPRPELRPEPRARSVVTPLPDR